MDLININRKTENKNFEILNKIWMFDGNLMKK